MWLKMKICQTRIHWSEKSKNKGRGSSYYKKLKTRDTQKNTSKQLQAINLLLVLVNLKGPSLPLDRTRETPLRITWRWELRVNRSTRARMPTRKKIASRMIVLKILARSKTEIVSARTWSRKSPRRTSDHKVAITLRLMINPVSAQRTTSLTANPSASSTCHQRERLLRSPNLQITMTC